MLEGLRPDLGRRRLAGCSVGSPSGVLELTKARAEIVVCFVREAVQVFVVVDWVCDLSVVIKAISDDRDNSLQDIVVVTGLRKINLAQRFSDEDRQCDR